MPPLVGPNSMCRLCFAKLYSKPPPLMPYEGAPVALEGRAVVEERAFLGARYHRVAFGLASGTAFRLGGPVTRVR